MSTISVIIPVYNTAAYLPRCLASVLGQTYRDLEVILIDDGSTDDSAALCDDFARKDARVRVIHQENGGLSAARNAGLDAACGDLIGFVDSDDWIEPDMYAYLVDLLEQDTSDIAEIMLEVAYSDDHRMRQLSEQKKLLEGDDILIHYFRHNEFAMGLRLYKREIFDEVRFDVGRMNEDVVAGFLTLSHAERLTTSNQPKYFYFSNPIGLSESPLRKRDLDLLYAGERLDELTADTANGALRKLALTKKHRSSFTLLVKMALFGCSAELDERQMKRQLQGTARENYDFLMASTMPVNRKLLLTACCVSYPLVKALVAGYRRIRGGKV
jgi:glycosyltransferase involved in cell wall biosynthesis